MGNEKGALFWRRGDVTSLKSEGVGRHLKTKNPHEQTVSAYAIALDMPEHFVRLLMEREKTIRDFEREPFDELSDLCYGVFGPGEVSPVFEDDTVDGVMSLLENDPKLLAECLYDALLAVERCRATPESRYVRDLSALPLESKAQAATGSLRPRRASS